MPSKPTKQKANCQQCGNDFLVQPNTKGKFCSIRCVANNRSKATGWQECSICLSLVGFGGHVQARLLGANKTAVWRFHKKHGIKTNAPKGGSWQQYANKRGWETSLTAQCRTTAAGWWGGTRNANAWMSEYRAKHFEWSMKNHPNISQYDTFTPKQKQAFNARVTAYRRNRRKSDPSFKHKEQAKINQWKRNNPDKLRSYAKIYRKRHPEKYKRSAMTPQQRAKDNMRKRFKHLIKTAQRGGSESFSKIIGCNTEWLRRHIEAQWATWMNWDNYGTGNGRRWHVDHIIPCAAFDHTDPRQVETCWHWTNLRPLCAEENINKSDQWGWSEVGIVINHLNSMGTLPIRQPFAVPHSPDMFEFKSF